MRVTLAELCLICRAVADAPPASGEHPLVVISHGNGGNWGNQVWLASALAHGGCGQAGVTSAVGV